MLSVDGFVLRSLGRPIPFRKGFGRSQIQANLGKPKRSLGSKRSTTRERFDRRISAHVDTGDTHAVDGDTRGGGDFGGEEAILLFADVGT